MSVLKWIRSILPGGPYLVTLTRLRLVVRDLQSGAVWDDSPLVELVDDNSGNKIAVAFGSQVNQTAHVVNPFDHPRIIIADFTVAERLLCHVFKQLSAMKWFAPSPRVVIYVKQALQGGLTDIEYRALMEMALGAGARQVRIWDKQHSPSEQEVWQLLEQSD